MEITRSLITNSSSVFSFSAQVSKKVRQACRRQVKVIVLMLMNAQTVAMLAPRTQSAQTLMEVSRAHAIKEKSRNNLVSQTISNLLTCERPMTPDVTAYDFSLRFFRNL